MSTYSKSFPRNKHNFYSEEMVPPLEDEEDPLGDKPARMVLSDNQLERDKRQTIETQDRLGSIQDRISRALSNYDLAADDSEESLEDMASFKKKSEEQFDIYIVGFNESAKIKNKLLDQLLEFFVSNEDDEVSTSPGIHFDLDKSYSVASEALAGATESLGKLSEIHNTLVETYSAKLKDKDSKKKGKQLAQSFKEAQAELAALKDTMEATEKGLNEANTKAEGLRRSLDMRTQEVEKNKQIIERLKKVAGDAMPADEKKHLQDRAAAATALEQEVTELKLHLATLEFNNRKGLSEAVKEEPDDTTDLLSELQAKMVEAQEQHEATLKESRAAWEAELEEAMQAKEEELEQLIAEVEQQNEKIEDLEMQLEEANEALAMRKSPSLVITPMKTAEPVTPVTPPETERTNSEVSIDPTEALKKKYAELEAEFAEKRRAVEEEIELNESTNNEKLEELTEELAIAKASWEQEKSQLEKRVEQFRRMVAEMEGEVQEKTHALAKKMKEEKEREVKEDNESLEDSSGDISPEMQASVNVRPNTAARNCFTPGPDNPVVSQVVTMYEHVNEFKNKITKILAEIQILGIIDETGDHTYMGYFETMLMKRSMEQITEIEFSPEGNIHQQIEDIQTNIAQVMHNSEKAVHKIFKKLSKERTKVESLSFMSHGMSEHGHRPISSMMPPSVTGHIDRDVEVCDRGTSPVIGLDPPPTRAGISGQVPRRNNKPASYTAMFAHQDVEHNRKSLKAAMQNHRITPKQYEEALGMMEDYSNIPTKRLAYLAKHYISHARMQLMEENINLNRPVCDDIDDVIGRLDQLYSLRKTRYGSAMDKLADEREDLAYLLTKQLDRLEHQSGIFLIKPYIAYKSNTLNVVKKENPFVPPPLMKSTESMMSEEVQDRGGAGGNWSVNTSRATSAHDWKPDVPRLLEMDINRVTVARNTVTQPGAMRTMKSFVVVRAAPKSGIRTRSNATSAEFLSIESFASTKSEDSSLPPLRNVCSSGFVSAQSSRQRLAPIQSPPPSISVEKALKS